MNKSIKRVISTILAATFAVCTPLINVYASTESVEEPEDLAVVDTSSEITSVVLSDNDIPDENERHFTYNNEFELNLISDGKYELVVIVDEEFLNNPATVYPVIVDPSVTINATGSGSSKSILDTPIYSGASGTAGVNSMAVIGYVDSSYKSGRLLMRFPGLMKQSFMSTNYTIEFASLTLRECSGGSAISTIWAHNYTGPAWDESTVYSSAAYNGVGSGIGGLMFSYPNKVTGSFDITSAVKFWQTNSAQGNKGIIFKNNTGETDAAKAKTFYTTEGSVKPYLSVTYFFNGCRGYKYENSENINCLAFAFNISEDTFRKENYFTNSDYNYCRSVSVADALARTKLRMTSWLNETLSGKWRPVSNYDATLNSNEWLVAMRVGVDSADPWYDYHFWYRASNGKWYNKHEEKPSEEVSGNVINPSTANTSNGWYHRDYPNYQFYTSDTVYYAIKQ